MRFAKVAALTFMSYVWSAISYSAKSTVVPLKELVSITSQPTSRNAVWTFSTASGRVISKFSLQPSNRRPPKSSSVRFCTCRFVPIAPSKTTMRSLRVSRKLLIKLLPISTLCQKPDRKEGQRCPCLRAGFRHDTCKSPALANNAGLSSNCFEQRLKVAELFSGLFYVAASRLNSPRFFQELLNHRLLEVSRQQWHAHL